MRKRLLVLAVALVLALRGAEGQEKVTTLEGLRNSLAAVEQAAGDYADTAPQLLNEVPAFIALQNEIGSIWQPALEHLDYVAPTPTQKSLFILSLEGLSPDDYVTAVERLIGLTETGKVAPQVLSRALAPRGKLEGLFVYNYDHPRTRELLLRAKTVLASNSSSIQSIESILSGDAKRGHDSYRSATAHRIESSGRPVPRLASTAQAAPSATAVSAPRQPLAESTPRLSNSPQSQVSPAAKRDSGRSSRKPLAWIAAAVVGCIVGFILLRKNHR